MKKFLREKPEGSDISRENMYIAYKKEHGDKPPVEREIIRKRGRKKQIHFIVENNKNNNNNNNNLNTIDVNDLPPIITNSSIEDLMLTDPNYLSNLIEKEKEEILKQKLHVNRIIKPENDDSERKQIEK
jgi:hypothetical protein